MRPLAALAILITLSACGADGEPTPPAQSTAQPGLTISGEAKLGVSVTR
jgi:predicted small lipoprotein YifL